MILCESCNKKFPDSYIFCPQCGTKFIDKKSGKNDSIDESNIIVACVDLHKSYLMGKTAVNALRGVDLKVAKGEFIAIMGPSGSGKSTLMHLLGGLDSPSRGQVLIRGEKNELVNISNLSKDELSEIRLKVTGFIFQQFYLLPTLSAEENIAIPLIFSSYPDSFIKSRVDELLNLVGLEKRGHHLPSELSGGEQQRVAIARALANDPPLVLADEPTGDLDSRTGQEIIQILKDLNELGKTVIMVTHDINVAEFANTIIKMQDGKFIERPES
ncbi:MAG: ATP-binding cassette domain-containing protein [Promethearchaeota archaeon]